MKQKPDLQKIQENMKPGSLSAHGFLGEDARNLADILAADQAVLDKLGLSHEAVADRMQHFTDQGKKGLGSPVLVDGVYEVVVEEFAGLISCPFRDHFKAEKRNTLVTNRRTGRTVHWTDLNIHMIRNHGFYEGTGSYFHVNPCEMAQVLGMMRE